MRQFHIHQAINPTFTEDEVQDRKYVGFVEADNLEKAFEYAQNDHVDWCFNQVRSTSVGDVIQDDDKFYLVMGVGFKQLTPHTEPLPRVILIMSEDDNRSYDELDLSAYDVLDAVLEQPGYPYNSNAAAKWLEHTQTDRFLFSADVKSVA